MNRVYVFVEGQTEETFVLELLRESFSRMGIHLTPIIFQTSKGFKGGVSTYGKVRWQVEKICKQDKTAYVTTMLDFYGLPDDFPGKREAAKKEDLREKIEYLEAAFYKDINQKRFIPNFLVHEFEALLFSGAFADAFGEWFGEETGRQLQEERRNFKSPEHIDDGPETAPSKRILRLCWNYNKIHHGSLIAEAIGLDTIRKECKHFNRWLEKLESLPKQAG
ncbi:MAG: DUF4276 family protein [bacterium]|nr:DUF4276 family protein [bacterium]